jgi:hypothetical protein
VAFADDLILAIRGESVRAVENNANRIFYLIPKLAIREDFYYYLYELMC